MTQETAPQKLTPEVSEVQPKFDVDNVGINKSEPLEISYGTYGEPVLSGKIIGVLTPQLEVDKSLLTQPKENPAA